MKNSIEAYHRIRSVPYKIIDVDYSLENAYALIASKGASCTPKHIALFDIFTTMGIETRLCVHEFEWLDFGLKFPTPLADLLHLFSADYHTNLEIKLGTTWILVDATWDDALIDAGLPGTKIWNGIEATINAVHSKKVYRFNTIEERKQFLLKNKKEHKDIEKEVECIQALNDYFETLSK